VYQALVTLTANPGYTFTGVGADSFTYTGAASITNTANSGTVTITFPPTAASGGDTVITTLSLDGKLTAPVKDATPDTTTIDETQYTGTIQWQTADGSPHSGPFAASTVYKALVTLTAKSGYTFTGVAANSFTYTGAASITNTANSGTVTITFPATTASDPNTGIPIGNPSVKLYLNGGTTPLSHNGNTDVGTAESGICTISIDSGSYSSIVWYLNGNAVTAAQDTTSIVLSKRTAGTYLLTVEVTPTVGVKQSGAHSFVVQ
jgi:hypothetical protein